MTPKIVKDTCVDRVKAGHESCPARCTNRVDVIVSEDDATVSKSVKVGSWYLV